MLTSSSPILHFDAFTLDAGRSVLLRGASELPLRRQSFDVLRYLAEHEGKIVSSDELVEAVWTSKPADRNSSVAQCVAEIRRAIGDDARWVIQTVSGRGYEFKAKVVRAETSQPDLVRAPANTTALPGRLPEVTSPWRRLQSIAGQVSRQQRIAAASVAVFMTLAVCGWLIRPRPEGAAPISLTMMAAPTLALLPFTGLGSDDGQRSLAAVLETELRSQLARAHRGFDLIIRPATDDRDRTSPHKVEASRLGARYVVLGSIWLDRDVERANIQLIETETDRQIWSESFETRPGELGSMERLAARLARLIGYHVGTVEGRRPLPDRPEAGHFVILGRALIEGERGSKQTRDAQAYFEKALALDASSIHALHGFAASKIDQVRNGWIPGVDGPAALDQAEAAIERIIKLDRRNVGAHFLRGYLLRERGDVDHAIAALEHALVLNPNFSLALYQLGRTKVDAGRAREGLQDIEEAIRMNPTDPSISFRYFAAGMAALHLGDDRAAVAWLLKARQADRKYVITIYHLAIAYLGVGDEQKAKGLITEYLRIAPRFSIAGWKRSMTSRNPIVIEQRKRIEDALRRLGVPEEDAAVAKR